MKKPRLLYAALIFSFIITGLLSRRISIIPLSTGDVLWAMMVFFIIRFLFVSSNISAIVFSGLAICFLIETSQLYQEEWINQIRQTIPGKLILGQGFLWSDILAYVAGIALASSIDFLLRRQGQA